MTETIELRPIIGTPEEVAKARQKFREGSRALLAPSFILLLGLPLGLFFFYIGRKPQDLVNPIILACIAFPMILTTQRVRHRSRTLQRLEKILCFSATGLTIKISYDGSPPEQAGKIDWKEITEVHDEPDAVVIRFRLGGESRLPNESFDSLDDRQAVIDRIRAGAND